jgi:hypothetical protein
MKRRKKELKKNQRKRQKVNQLMILLFGIHGIEKL